MQLIISWKGLVLLMVGIIGIAFIYKMNKKLNFIAATCGKLNESVTYIQG